MVLAFRDTTSINSDYSPTEKQQKKKKLFHIPIENKPTILLGLFNLEEGGNMFLLNIR
jgi:hypothetical protein